MCNIFAGLGNIFNEIYDGFGFFVSCIIFFVMMLFFITYEVCSTREVSFKNRACHFLLNTVIFKNAGVLGTFSLE